MGGRDFQAAARPVSFPATNSLNGLKVEGDITIWFAKDSPNLSVIVKFILRTHRIDVRQFFGAQLHACDPW